MRQGDNLQTKSLLQPGTTDGATNAPTDPLPAAEPSPARAASYQDADTAPLFFFSGDDAITGYLSQWYNDDDGHFCLDGQLFTSAEQAMMNAKATLFGDRGTADA